MAAEEEFRNQAPRLLPLALDGTKAPEEEPCTHCSTQTLAGRLLLFKEQGCDALE